MASSGGEDNCSYTISGSNIGAVLPIIVPLSIVNLLVLLVNIAVCSHFARGRRDARRAKRDGRVQPLSLDDILRRRTTDEALHEGTTATTTFCQSSESQETAFRVQFTETVATHEDIGIFSNLEVQEEPSVNPEAETAIVFHEACARGYRDSSCDSYDQMPSSPATDVQPHTHSQEQVTSQSAGITHECAVNERSSIGITPTIAGIRSSASCAALDEPLSTSDADAADPTATLPPALSVCLHSDTGQEGGNSDYEFDSLLWSEASGNARGRSQQRTPDDVDPRDDDAFFAPASPNGSVASLPAALAGNSRTSSRCSSRGSSILAAAAAMRPRLFQALAKSHCHMDDNPTDDCAGSASSSVARFKASTLALRGDENTASKGAAASSAEAGETAFDCSCSTPLHRVQARSRETQTSSSSLLSLRDLQARPLPTPTEKHTGATSSTRPKRGRPISNLLKEYKKKAMVRHPSAPTHEFITLKTVPCKTEERPLAKENMIANPAYEAFGGASSYGPQYLSHISSDSDDEPSRAREISRRKAAADHKYANPG